tara:strand:+ start:48 stop:692 length:645 start_codon:yes stop_codon:yes gene_type:complete
MRETVVSEVALFPIPTVVSFPGTTVPLHVFEPRYRRLVQDCIDDERLLGVTHTVKTIREAPREQDDALATNQATYQPQTVFSAGMVALVDTTPDGRLLVEVAMRERYELGPDKQTLPYRIAECTLVVDDPEPDRAPRNAELQTLINAKLITIAGTSNPTLVDLLQSEEWTGRDPGDFSFRVFQFLRFDADFMQGLLEMRSAGDRLERVWDALSA